MTNEEAITVLKVHREFFNEEIGEALDMAIKALEKQEKYRWHDLRKNPDDLPKEFGVYLCICDMDLPPECLIWQTEDDDLNFPLGWRSNTDWVFGGSQNIDRSEMLAWREIEPFESEDDC